MAKKKASKNSGKLSGRMPKALPDPKSVTTTKLVKFLKKANAAYREGSPLIDDETINDTCTLLPGEAKPAVRLTILISDDGKAVAERPVFEPSVTSREKMSYISISQFLQSSTT